MLPHHVPLQHVTVIQTPTARSNPAGKRLGLLDSRIQKCFLKLPQSTPQPLNAEKQREMPGERLCRALTPPLSFIPSPSPHPAPTITVQSQAPKEAEIENTFSLKHSLNFMNSITLDFLSISWSEYCKTREKGGRGAV